jgi:hypothetical protein
MENHPIMSRLLARSAKLSHSMDGEICALEKMGFTDMFMGWLAVKIWETFVLNVN